MASTCPKKNVSFSSVANAIADEIEAIYVKASLPMVSKTRILQLIRTLHDKYYNIRKNFKRDKIYQEKQKEYTKYISDCESNLFDVCSCKCQIHLHCACDKPIDKCICAQPVVIECSCSADRKIPVLERKFVYAQRYHRIRKIGTVDKKESEKLEKRLERKRIQAKHETAKSFETSTNIVSLEINTESETEETDAVDKQSDPDFQIHFKSSSSFQMTTKLTNTALTSDRYGVSDRATAAILLLFYPT